MGLFGIISKKKKNTELTYTDAQVKEIVKRSMETNLMGVKNPFANIHLQDSQEPATKQDFLKLYNKYVWVFTCVKKIATTCAKSPMRFYDVDSNGDIIGPSKNKQWSALFYNPNPFQSYTDFIEGWVSSSELVGDAFVEKGGANPDNPEQLYVMNPAQIRVIPDTNTLFRGYRQEINGRVIATFEPEEIMHFKYYNPLSMLYGTAPGSSIESSILMDMYALTYQKNFFRRGAVMPNYISVPSSLKTTEFERFKEEVRSLYSGSNKQFSMGIFDNNAQVKEIGISPEKTMLKEQRLLNREEVLSAYGVPALLLGIFGNATYDNVKEAKKEFIEDTIVPKLSKIEELINKTFLQENNMIAKFDLSVFPSLQDDQQKKAISATSVAGGAVLTPNEARALFYPNLQAIEGGNKLMNPSVSGGLIVPRGVATPNEARAYWGLPNIAGGDELVQPKPPTEITKALTEKGFKTEYRKNSKLILDGAIIPTFDKWEKSVNAVISKLYTPKNKVSKASTRDKEILTQANVSLESGTTKLITDLAKIESQIIIDQIQKDYVRITGELLPQNILDKEKVRIVKETVKFAKVSGKSITETMSGRIKLFLSKSLEEDVSLADITKGIQEIFKGTPRDKYPWARTISRTESSKATNSARYESMKVAKVKKKQWVWSGLDREDHGRFDNQGPKPIDYVYKSSNGGIRFPGDPRANVGHLANCACTITEILE